MASNDNTAWPHHAWNHTFWTLITHLLDLDQTIAVLVTWTSLVRTLRVPVAVDSSWPSARTPTWPSRALIQIEANCFFFLNSIASANEKGRHQSTNKGPIENPKSFQHASNETESSSTRLMFISPCLLPSCDVRQQTQN